MNKKAQVETIIGIILIVGLLASGIYSSKELLSEYRYVGDKSKNVSYDMSSCIVNIEKNNAIMFHNIEEVEKSGYKIEQCR